MKSALELYKIDLLDPAGFSDEFLLWQARWRRKNETERPKTAAQTLVKCDSTWFPNVRRLIEVNSGMQNIKVAWFLNIFCFRFCQFFPFLMHQ
jgi:hypothetical protein